LTNSKTQNAFLFTVHAIFRHDYPLAVEPASTPRPIVQKKLWEILYLLICSFLSCLSWLLRSRVRNFRRDLWITLYFSRRPDWLWDPSGFRLKGLLRWGCSVWGVELTGNFHLAPRSRSSGAVPSLPIHAFIACTGVSVALPLPSLLQYPVTLLDVVTERYECIYYLSLVLRLCCPTLSPASSVNLCGCSQQHMRICVSLCGFIIRQLRLDMYILMHISECLCTVFSEL